MLAPALPCPNLSITIELPEDAAIAPDFAALPAKPGVFVIEDEARRPLLLSTTANLRRMVASKLQPPEPESGPTRRINYRGIARQVGAVTVGSRFEADWAYLQLARQLLPATYRSLLDRWQAWFVQCDESAAFPQFTKTAHPSPASGCAFIGPFGDKHAAARYIELLEDAFELCRYHHILVQAPRAAACAYKEMGRCPAPCDGTISMQQYRASIREAIDFSISPIEQWRDEQQRQMQRASECLDFEAARFHRQRLERTTAATKPEFAHVDALHRLRFIAVLPSEKKRWARIFLIRGGWIAPICDVPVDLEKQRLNELLREIRGNNPAVADPSDLSQHGIENIGMFCWHLFRPRKTKSGGLFQKLGETIDGELSKALRDVGGREIEPEENEDFADHDLNGMSGSDLREGL